MIYIYLVLGHGFVLDPNNSKLKEDTLVLEGFRFIDRSGNLDKKLAEKNNSHSGISCNDSGHMPRTINNYCTNLAAASFEKNKAVLNDLIKNDKN